MVVVRVSLLVIRRYLMIIIKITIGFVVSVSRMEK